MKNVSKAIGETPKTRRFYPELFKMTNFVSAKTYQLNENKLKCTVRRVCVCMCVCVCVCVCVFIPFYRKGFS